MQAKLKSTPKEFFKDYVRLLNPLLKLRRREAEVLEAHLRVYYINYRLPDIDRLLFSFPTQRDIRSELRMSSSSYNNHKVRLRRKNCIIRNTINPLIINRSLIESIRKTGKLQLTYQLEVTNISK
jgi:hypothetical protein